MTLTSSIGKYLERVLPGCISFVVEYQDTRHVLGKKEILQKNNRVAHVVSYGFARTIENSNGFYKAKPGSSNL